MEGKRQGERYVQSFHVGTGSGAASEIIDPKATVAIVVGIVVGSVRRRVDAVGYACPLQVIARTFKVAWVAAHLRHKVELWLVGVAVGLRVIGMSLGVGRDLVAIGGTCNVSHSSAELHGIGGKHLTGGLAEVAQLHEPAFALGETEGSKVNPRTAAHGLVHGEACHAILVVNGVKGVFRAVGQCLVSHVHGIASVLGYLWRPFGRGLFSFLLAFGREHFPERAFGEWVLKIGVLLAGIGEARAIAGAPRLRAVVL